MKILTTSDNILNEIKSYKKSQADAESKLYVLEDPIISAKVASKELSNDNT